MTNDNNADNNVNNVSVNNKRKQHNNVINNNANSVNTTTTIPLVVHYLTGGTLGNFFQRFLKSELF